MKIKKKLRVFFTVQRTMRDAGVGSSTVDKRSDSTHAVISVEDESRKMKYEAMRPGASE
jgi:hypothetical protein